MDNNQVFLDIISKLTEKAITTTVSSVNDRIETTKVKKNDEKTINELEEIIQELLDIKTDLLRAISIFEEEFVAQQIGEEDLTKIKESVIPAIKTFIQELKPLVEPNENFDKVDDMLDSFSPLLSYEVLNLLQSLGFNYKEAIGKPLTERVKQFITKDDQKENNQQLASQNVELITSLAKISMDKEATERFKELSKGKP